MGEQIKTFVTIIYRLYYFYYEKFHQGFLQSCLMFGDEGIECNCLKKGMLEDLLECFKDYFSEEINLDDNIVVKCEKGEQIVRPKTEDKWDNSFFSIFYLFNELMDKNNIAALNKNKEMQFFYLVNCTVAFFVKDLNQKIHPENHISIYKMLLIKNNSECFGLLSDDEEHLKGILFDDPFLNHNFDKKIECLDTNWRWNDRDKITRAKQVLENWYRITSSVDCVFQVMSVHPNVYKVRNFSNQVQEGSLPSYE